MRVSHIVGPFDGVVIKSVVGTSIEQAVARCLKLCGEFQAAQNSGRVTEEQTTIALDCYIAVNGGERLAPDSKNDWQGESVKNAGWLVVQYRYIPGRDLYWARLPEIMTVIGWE